MSSDDDSDCSMGAVNGEHSVSHLAVSSMKRASSSDESDSEMNEEDSVVEKKPEQKEAVAVVDEATRKVAEEEWDLDSELDAYKDRVESRAAGGVITKLTAKRKSKKKSSSISVTPTTSEVVDDWDLDAELANRKVSRVSMVGDEAGLQAKDLQKQSRSKSPTNTDSTTSSSSPPAKVLPPPSLPPPPLETRSDDDLLEEKEDSNADPSYIDPDSFEGFKAIGVAYRKMRESQPKWKPVAKLFSCKEGDERNENGGVKFKFVISKQEELLEVNNKDDFEVVCRQGATFIKRSRFGRPHTKLFHIEPITGECDWGSGSVNLSESIEIRAGKNTKVLEKLSLKEADPRMCFSIVCVKRTIDLQANSVEQQVQWVEGLKKLIETRSAEWQAAAALNPAPAVTNSRRFSFKEGFNKGGDETNEAIRGVSKSLLPADKSMDRGLLQICNPAGTIFIKHGRTGKPKAKLIRVNHNLGLVDWGSGSLPLKECVEIKAGKNTKVFEGVKISSADSSHCFSIVSPNRTLDLQASNEQERDQWVEGLNRLLTIVLEREQRQAEVDNFNQTNPEDSKVLASDRHMLPYQHFELEAEVGIEFAQFSKSGFNRSRNVVVKVDIKTGDLSVGDSMLTMNDVLDIVAGKEGSKAFEAAPTTVDEDCCFSIIFAGDKTIDLAAKTSAVASRWVAGLRSLLTTVRLRRHTLIQLKIREENTILGSSKHWLKVIAEGCWFIKHSRFGRPKSKKITVDAITGVVDWGSGTLPLQYATCINTGHSTKVFDGSKVDPKLCFSIIHANRTLDLQASNEQERDMWVRGLVELWQRLQVSVAPSLASAKRALENRYKTGEQVLPSSRMKSLITRRQPSKQSSDDDSETEGRRVRSASQGSVPNASSSSTSFKVRQVAKRQMRGKSATQGTGEGGEDGHARVASAATDGREAIGGEEEGGDETGGGGGGFTTCENSGASVVTHSSNKAAGSHPSTRSVSDVGNLTANPSTLMIALSEEDSETEDDDDEANEKEHDDNKGKNMMDAADVSSSSCDGLGIISANKKRYMYQKMIERRQDLLVPSAVGSIKYLQAQRKQATINFLERQASEVKLPGFSAPSVGLRLPNSENISSSGASSNVQGQPQKKTQKNNNADSSSDESEEESEDSDFGPRGR